MTDLIVLKQTYSSPLSFVGATRRLTGWARRKHGAASTLAWFAVVLALPLVWVFLVVWYVVALGVFGVFTFPWRWHRRHQRKSLAVQEAQLATMQEMLRERDRQTQQG